MAMATTIHFRCWQVNDDNSEEHFSSIDNSIDSRLFKIDFNFCYDVSYFDRIFEYFSESITHPRDMVLNEHQFTQILISTFIDMGLPDLTYLRDCIIPFILSSLRLVDADPTNYDLSVIKLNVMVYVNDNSEDEESYDEVPNELLSEVNFKPACESAIRDLNRVKYTDVSLIEKCSICLGEFSYGEELVLMPCEHVYHDACIVQWLETSHFCPLCRYEMPS